MKNIFIAISVCIVFASCDSTKNMSSGFQNHNYGINADTAILQSLFTDKASTISEENIQIILEGNFTLPNKLRVALVKLDGADQRKYFWNDEDYLKTQQSYIDRFIQKLTVSPRVNKVTVIPDLLISRSPSFTNIREAAVRMQADVVVAYSISSDIYTRYKFLAKADIKAFATTQLILLDVRTGLIPFSIVVTKDVLSKKKNEEMDIAETNNRIKSEAVQLTIDDIGQKLAAFLQ